MSNDVVVPDEAWRNQVITLAKAQLASAGGQLRARVPGSVARLGRPVLKSLIARRFSLTGNVRSHLRGN